jgi:hypothetical protein
LPKSVGPCTAAIQRFYFDAETMTCTNFSYSGCKGNANNFQNVAACRARCNYRLQAAGARGHFLNGLSSLRGKRIPKRSLELVVSGGANFQQSFFEKLPSGYKLQRPVLKGFSRSRGK